MTSPTPYLVAENPAVNHYVHLLLTNNNHFEFSIPKDNSSTLSYSKIKKKDYKKPEKKLRIYRRNRTIYAEKTLNAREENLLNGGYPIEITSLETVEFRKKGKEDLEIIKKDQRYKFVKSKFKG